MPGTREDHRDAVGGQPVAEPARLAVDEDEREADDDGGDGEGDVDERIEQPGAREAVAGQDERRRPTPKMVLSGTAMPATSSVSQSACRASGAVKASHAVPSPC